MARTRLRPKRTYIRLTRWRRRRFLALLEESGNVRMAAALAGVGIKAVYRLRVKEPDFAARMDAASEKASDVLRGASSPASAGAGRSAAAQDEREGLVVRRGAGGRLRLVAAGPHRWEARHDPIFLGHLAATGNVRASARAAGFTAKSAWNRRAAVPGFAAAWDEAAAQAEVHLHGRLVAEIVKYEAVFDDEAFDAADCKPFDPWLAIAFLRFRAGKRRREGSEIPAFAGMTKVGE